MSEATMTTAVELDGVPRLAGLDILRGIAILGILFMNINDMGGALFASFGDVRHLGWTRADQIAWWCREVFANGTARCMLEMLFGVGMVILTDRAAYRIAISADAPTGLFRTAGAWLFGPRTVLRGYYWRNFVLFVFGLAHIFLLMWPGDILHTYGIAAMVAFLFRRLGPKTLLLLGLNMALLQLIGGGISIHSAQTKRVENLAVHARYEAGQRLTAAEYKTLNAYNQRRIERARDRIEVQKRLAREDDMRRASTGTAHSWFASAWDAMLYLWGRDDDLGKSSFLEPLFVWEAASTMLVGAALFKWGIIQGLRSRRFYFTTMLAAYAVGLGGRAVLAYWEMQFDRYPHFVYATSEATRLATTLGHIAAVYTLLATVAGARLLKPFEAAGRTALTIYVCQTIACLWLLYPPFALGLYGKQGWMALMLTALAVNAVLLVAANFYLRRYRIAPVEWAWRSILAGRLLPIRRDAEGARPGAIAAVA